MCLYLAIKRPENELLLLLFGIKIVFSAKRKFRRPEKKEINTERSSYICAYSGDRERAIWPCASGLSVCVLRGV